MNTGKELFFLIMNPFIEEGYRLIYIFGKKIIMSDTYFDKSTIALGTIYTVVLLAIVGTIVFFG